jgi:fibronectin type 3 domain-containing protein
MTGNRTLARTTARRVVAALVGGAVATTSAGALVAPADATAAPGQDVLNDWGQTVDEVDQEVNVVVDADPAVIAARTRYINALVAYASAKHVQAVAAASYKSAVATAGRTTIARRLASLRTANTKVFTTAREVAASQLAMVKLVDARTAAVRARHYVQAPVVLLPTAPAGLTAVGASGQVTLSWTPVSGATGYHVLRDGVQIATTTAAGYTDTGLDNGALYGYQVLATNVAGWSPLTASVTGTPNVVAPATPTNLVAAPGDGTVTLAWTAVPGATSYQVFRGATLLGSPTATTFADSGLIDGTSYSYTVKALNGSAASGATAPVSCTPVATAPSAPTGVVATPGNATVTVTWTASPGATSYTVMRNGIAVATQAGTTYTDSSAANGTTYSYYVLAYRLNSPASAPSTSASATPAAPPLASPTGVSATPGDTTVSLAWSAVPGATGYDVYRGGAKVATVATTIFNDAGLTNGTTYSYYVVATGTAPSSSPSATVTATPAAAKPGAPTGLSGTAGDKTAALSWTAVSGATSYNVYRGGVKIGSSATTTYADSGLANGTPYTYYVTAIKGGVESAASSTVSVTPFVLTPAVPTGLVATPGNAQVSISWAPAANATGYLVYRGATLVATQSGTSFTDMGLVNGTSYIWTVVATNGTAQSAASAPLSATPVAPAPAAPTGLAATPGNTQVALTWTAVATATSYKVYRNGVFVASSATTSFTDTGLTNATVYTYYVTAVAATTEGPASSSVSATPAKPPVNGTFTGAITNIGSGSSVHGTIKVVITVTNSVITLSKGTLVTNDGSETTKINSTAIPQYDTKAVAANGTTFTKVSGATLTFTAYKTSLQSAITAAGL